MANPELSRKAADLFNKYKVPMDIALSWATQIEAAKSEDNLSQDLQDFLSKPYFIKNNLNTDDQTKD